MQCIDNKNSLNSLKQLKTAHLNSFSANILEGLLLGRTFASEILGPLIFSGRGGGLLSAFYGIYSRIPISRTSKGNKNWFEKSGVREIEGGIKRR